MIRTVLLAATIALAAGSPANAAPCRGAAGKFVKCPPPAAAAPATGARCKDAKGRFAKCGTAGAKPIAAKK